MTTRKSHRGLADLQGHPQAPIDHAAAPDSPDPTRARCQECGRPLSYRKRTYGPNGRAGGWTHRGDGLAQYRAWR